MSTRNIIDAIASGSALDIESAFEDTMAEKVSVQIGEKRLQIAQTMFATKEVVAEEVELDENQKYEYAVCLTKGKTVGARQHRIINVNASDKDEAEKLAREEHKKKFPYAPHKDFYVSRIISFGKTKEE